MTPGYDDDTPILEMYADPEAPEYTIDFNQMPGLDILRDLQDVRNQVIVTYDLTPAPDGARGEDQVLEYVSAVDVDGADDIDGQIRDWWIDAQQDFPTPSNFFPAITAQAELTRVGRLTAKGISFQVGGSSAITVLDEDNNVVPAWRIRAGYRINITNLPSGTPPFADLITKVSYDWAKNIATVQTGILPDPRRAYFRTSYPSTSFPAPKDTAKADPLVRPELRKLTAAVIGTLATDTVGNSAPVSVPFRHRLWGIILMCAPGVVPGEDDSVTVNFTRQLQDNYSGAEGTVVGTITLSNAPYAELQLDPEDVGPGVVYGAIIIAANTGPSLTAVTAQFLLERLDPETA